MTYELHYTRKIVHNHGTEDEPNIVEYLQEESVGATDADYDVQMAFAKEHSYNGEVTVYEVPDPETPDTPATPTDDHIWEELDKAYQEGVDSV